MRVLLLTVLAALTMPAVAQATGPVVSSAGHWELKRSARGAANEGTCLLAPKTPSRIQVFKDRLVVTGLPKNSIFNYQYRIDDGSASTPTIPSSAMQNDGIITLEGDALDTIVNGRRFQIRILDQWHEAITEDLDLSGLKDLYGTMTQACR
jgi:hypothetical protein